MNVRVLIIDSGSRKQFNMSYEINIMLYNVIV